MNPDVFAARAGDEVDFSAFLTGAKVKDSPKEVRIELGLESETPSDFLESPYFIVSDRMRAALTSFGVDNIDYIPAVLVRPDIKREYRGYWLGNVVGLVSCVDPAKSKYDQLSGSKKILRGFVVNESATQGLPLFRLKENRLLVLISLRLKEHLQSQGLQGLYFQETLKYDRKPASTFWEDGEDEDEEDEDVEEEDEDEDEEEEDEDEEK